MWLESEWKFDNLTDTEKAEVRELAGRKEWKKLAAIYKEKKVMPGCSFCSLTSDIRDWTIWAIHEGKI